MIQAMPGRIWCKELTAEDVYDGALYLKKLKKDKPLMGIAVSVGDKFFTKKGKCFFPPCSEGDLVFFKRAGIIRATVKNLDYVISWFEDVVGYIPKGGFDEHIGNLQKRKRKVPAKA